MSVPAYKRNESKMEFLKIARDIEVKLIKLLTNKPKRYRFYYQQLISLSFDILNNIKQGNSIYVEIKSDVELRVRYFKISIAKLQALISQMEVLYYIFKDDGITIKAVEELSEMINKEIILIQGVLKDCRARYSNLLNT